MSSEWNIKENLGFDTITYTQQNDELDNRGFEIGKDYKLEVEHHDLIVKSETGETIMIADFGQLTKLSEYFEEKT